MKKRLLFFNLFLFGFVVFALGQGTFSKVYALFQQKCISCHNTANPSGGLSLEGVGSNQVNRESSVHSRIVNANPTTAWAFSGNLKLVTPGRVDKSFLFHKINRGLEPTLSLPAQAGEAMPQNGSPQLTDAEKELVRQWILFGAPRLGTPVDEQIVNNFYNNPGLKSFPGGPPAAPAANEGFQIKMGPFFLNPLGQANDELEYFTKYKLDLPANVEINRIEVFMPDYAQQFSLYNFNPGGDLIIPNGFRKEPDHNSNTNLTVAVQNTRDLKLPQGTAFRWLKDIVLDLNARFLNISTTKNYQAEVYLNVYTQPQGTALHEMKTLTFSNENIPIPNTGTEITHTQILNSGAGEIFVWGMLGRTRKYGKDYKVYKRENGARGEMIYDASCPLGVPECASPFYDYRRIPMQYNRPLLPILLNASNGMIHEAKWINNGPASVNFGTTSNDELMALSVLYTTDTTGVTYTGLKETNPGYIADFVVSPNPFSDYCRIDFSKMEGTLKWNLLDLNGKILISGVAQGGSNVQIEKGSLQPGVYFLKVTDERSGTKVHKVMVQ